jgi:uncharacterized membrane protein
MQPIVFGTFIAISRIAVAMCSAGIAAFLVGLFVAKDEIAEAHGLDTIVALTNLCVAMPLAVFGALHLFAPQFVLNIVPAYMPWRLFWAYFVGCGLVAASLSIASRVGVRWSGLLFGIMMFSFVAMIHLPGALRDPHNRILWTIVFRESSFGGAGWILAATATNGWRGPAKITLITVARILVLIIYAPVLIFSLLQPNVGVEVEGINYFADALLFAGAILTLARATPSAAAKIYTAFPAQKPEAQAH